MCPEIRLKNGKIGGKSVRETRHVKLIINKKVVFSCGVHPEPLTQRSDIAQLWRPSANKGSWPCQITDCYVACGWGCVQSLLLVPGSHNPSTHPMQLVAGDPKNQGPTAYSPALCSRLPFTTSALAVSIICSKFLLDHSLRQLIWEGRLH